MADPAGRVHPAVIEVMREVGIDLSDRRPQRLSTALAEQADVVVTMGCGDACPYIPGKRYIDCNLADPKGRPIEEVRQTRDEITRLVEGLLQDLDAASPGTDEAASRRLTKRRPRRTMETEVMRKAAVSRWSSLVFSRKMGAQA